MKSPLLETLFVWGTSILFCLIFWAIITELVSRVIE